MKLQKILREYERNQKEIGKSRVLVHSNEHLDVVYQSAIESGIGVVG